MDIISRKWMSTAGELRIASYGDKLCMCDWTENARHEQMRKRIERGLGATFVEGTSAVIEEAIRQLREYFDGVRTTFDLKVRLVGSDFQTKAWEELKRIPYGTTISYREQACRIGDAKAVRAVAGANAVNAVSIIVPCHRVIGANGKLVGFGGGVDAKRILLEVERPSLFKP